MPKDEGKKQSTDDSSVGSWDSLSDHGQSLFCTQTEAEIVDFLNKQYRSKFTPSVVELDDEKITEEELAMVTDEIMQEIPELLERGGWDSDSEDDSDTEGEDKGKKARASALAKIKKQEDEKKTGLTEQAYADMTPANPKTDKKYTGYVGDFYEFNENEGGKGIEDEVTLCNFFRF